MCWDWTGRAPFRDIVVALERRFPRCPCVVRIQGSVCYLSDLGYNLGNREASPHHLPLEGTERRRIDKRLPVGQPQILHPARNMLLKLLALEKQLV